ncbi:MAG TPA: DUF2147 domain-containing protein [Methyloceanibacter sp.]|nr:DUF2147 domain-containing protein [Methyloceanibacter sp.]
MRHHAFAAAMGLVTAAMLAPCSQSHAATADPTGYWYKPDAERESKIQVFKCGSGKSQLCAKIIWLKDPTDSKGKALHDIRNEDPSMRDRPIVGLTIFSGLMPSAPATWTGKVYNPEDGHTYAATLTMMSRTQIMLRGCKAWLLCGEKQWLRTSPPPAAVPATAPEGTQQIEASATPGAAAPAAAASSAAATTPSVAKAEPAPAPAAPVVEAAVDHAAPASANADASPAAAATESTSPAATMQAAVNPTPQTVAQPVTLVSPAPQAGTPPAQKGYGFLNASMTSDTATKYSGENVSSMFNMTSPIPTQPAAQTVSTQATAPSAPAAYTASASAAASGAAQSAATTQAAADVPLPVQKPKVSVKSQAVAAKATPKPTATASSEQGAPAPEDGTAADAEGDTQSAQADTADAEQVPLTRRQMRRLRRQQEQQEPFLPWLR